MDDIRASTALEAFARAQLPRLLEVARLLAADRAVAADLAVTALRAVAAQWDRFDNEADRIQLALTTLARSAPRRHARDWGQPPASALVLRDAAEPEPTADVSEALAYLTDRERVAVVLHLVGGLDVRQVSRAVRRPIRSVSGELERAVSHLAAVAGSTNLAEDASVVTRALRLTAQPPIPTEPVMRTLHASLDSHPPAQPARHGRLVAATATVAVLAVVGAGVAVDRGRHADRTAATPPVSTSAAPATQLPDLPSSAPGLRLVGYEGLMLAVPESWTSLSSTSLGSARGASVSFEKASRADLPSLNRTRDELSAQRVAITSMVRAKDGYLQYAALLDTDVVAAVRAPRRAQVAALIASVQEVPRGYVAVPSCTGLDPDTAVSALSLAGLKAKVFSDPSIYASDLPFSVANQAPAIGAIVPFGSTVNLGVIAG